MKLYIARTNLIIQKKNKPAEIETDNFSLFCQIETYKVANQATITRIKYGVSADIYFTISEILGNPDHVSNFTPCLYFNIA